MNIAESLRIVGDTLQRANASTADSDNVSRIIAAFADLSRLREMKVRSIASAMRRNSWEDEFGATGQFDFKYRGETFTVLKCAINTAGDGYDDDCNLFWSYDDKRCLIARAGFHSRMAPFVIGSFVAESWPEPDSEWCNLTDRILRAIEDEDYCQLCGQLKFTMEKFTVCSRCAREEMVSTISSAACPAESIACRTA